MLGLVRRLLMFEVQMKTYAVTRDGQWFTARGGFSADAIEQSSLMAAPEALRVASIHHGDIVEYELKELRRGSPGIVENA